MVETIIILGLALAAAIVAIITLMSRLSATKIAIATERANADAARQALERECQQHTSAITTIKNEAANNLAQQRADAAQALATAKNDAAMTLATLKQEYAGSLERQKAEFERVYHALEARFKELAAKALADNAENLRQQNRNGLAEVLEPMKDNLASFNKTISEQHNEATRQRYSLNERVKELIDLNNTIGVETRRLTDAIRGNTRMQGNWGEMILDNILSQAGFRRGYEYTVQTSAPDENGKQCRPDVIINYTDGRKIIIDSKVSIQDYVKMLNADNEDARKQYAQAHVASVRKHITELKDKRYQDVIGKDGLDYVLMFIPHEGAFLAALDIDNQLWQTAYDNHVLIISPTHLMSIVKLIEQMWRQEKQNTNAQMIAAQASKLLDKLNGFLSDMDSIDRAIQATRNAWDGAFNKLSTGKGSVMRHATIMQSLGAKAKKALPDRYTSMIVDEDIQAIPEATDISDTSDTSDA